jgi:hypothetical protein
MNIPAENKLETAPRRGFEIASEFEKTGILEARELVECTPVPRFLSESSGHRSGGLMRETPTEHDFPLVAEMIVRLRRSGWSIEYAAMDRPTGRLWVVSGHHGQDLIWAMGMTEAEAWWHAVEQAWAVGMFGPDEPERAMKSGM